MNDYVDKMVRALSDLKLGRTAVTRRRLDDGMRALQAPAPHTADERNAALEVLQAGALAVQSLDDLGRYANVVAQEALEEIERRIKVVKGQSQ
jgi:hypothetical protein